ncbi:hypothetical protein F5X98DRAFT_371078 [Xylaria grammica]|nr:hypothetical protein F5X98DRAFT_371078 [Xylaria grammica]
MRFAALGFYKQMRRTGHRVLASIVRAIYGTIVIRIQVLRSSVVLAALLGEFIRGDLELRQDHNDGSGRDRTLPAVLHRGLKKQGHGRPPLNKATGLSHCAHIHCASE